MDELLPCPFCGGEANPELSWSKDREVVNVRCINWGDGGCLGAGANSRSEEEATAAWNTRAALKEKEHD